MKKDKKVFDPEKVTNEKEEPENINTGSEEMENRESANNKTQAERDLIAEKDKKIEELKKEAADLKDKFLRKAAEFENYKRRTENDQLNLLKYAAESLILKLLPIIDDFERSLDHIESSKDIDSLKQGIKLIYDKFMKILNEQGVKKIVAIGQPFNVEYHEALMQRKSDDVAPHTVLDEIEKGYIYKDRVIRHAKVIVSEDKGNIPSETDTSEDETAED